MHGLLRCRTGHTGSQVGDTRSSDNADANIPLYVSVVAEYNFWKKNTVKINISLVKVLRRALGWRYNNARSHSNKSKYFLFHYIVN